MGCLLNESQPWSELTCTLCNVVERLSVLDTLRRTSDTNLMYRTPQSRPVDRQIPSTGRQACLELAFYLWPISPAFSLTTVSHLT